MNTEEVKKAAPEQEETMALDDARRVKVLSPSMMVFKRFIRNKLAIIGFIILVIMFVFSFVGPLFSPYTSAQLFTHQSDEWKPYATGRYNSDPHAQTEEGVSFPSAASAQMLLAVSKAGGPSKLKTGDQLNFEYNGQSYLMEVLEEDETQPTYIISASVQVANGLSGRLMKVDPAFDTPEIRAALEERTAQMANGADTVEVGGYTFNVSTTKKEIRFEMIGEPGILVTYDTYLVLDPAYTAQSESFGFADALYTATAKNAKSFTFDSVKYAVEERENETVVSVDGVPVLMVSDLAFGAAQNGIELSASFIETASEMIRGGETRFEFTDVSGETVTARINLVNGNYYVETAQNTQLLSVTEAPSKEHRLGTDKYGMDLLTRLMYGGRVSLMVGFVVVFFELFLGVIIGGISGHFGGWVDTMLMRLVDLVNAIPFYPTIIIIGSVLDHLKVDAVTRLFLLMVVMGILGWTGIARIVRGQILSLREQDFMVATEATGIRTGRRIFKHLVPNVMPLLIVNATMSLGGVILSEATLGFLGLGVKYPMASWGSIINQATDMHIMTTAWWIWIPAGFLILITVLGFNFVGDGLRDAFDPKMKR